MGAALTGGKYILNASSSQGILYGLESHFVTVGKKIGGFVLQIAARVVSRNSLNVMAGLMMFMPCFHLDIRFFLAAIPRKLRIWQRLLTAVVPSP